MRFFRKTLPHHGELALLNTDKSKEKTIKIRQNKYLNNRIEQDH
ncbi:transposase (fragment) [Xenorhabdus bovienii str. Jollieti]|uniref:Transposase n=1 Tax=Xenorhabdus bovienii (strain SS-2004) TaxID=406818 RepID=D3V3C6_XENBS